MKVYFDFPQPITLDYVELFGKSNFVQIINLLAIGIS